MYDREKYDWETREDADTIKRFRKIQSDPARMSRAKACIQDSVNEGRKALGAKVDSPVGRRSNPATIKQLKV